MNRIEKLLNKIMAEASTGNVDCGSLESLYFKTEVNINGQYHYYDILKEYPDTIPPVLHIQNKKQLIYEIMNYVELARKFYTESDYQYIDDKDKYIIVAVMQNMGLEDFQNPISFFRTRRDFLLDEILKGFQQPKCIGYSDILGADIYVELKQEPIYLETPYGLHISLVKKETDIHYPLQAIRFGISDNKAYIYAIQKDKEEQLEESIEANSFYKKVKRNMYKTGSNFKNEMDLEDDLFNLYEVSPWTLVAITITLGLLKSAGVEEIVVPPLLVNRWNATHVTIDTEIKNWSYFQNPFAKDYIDKFEKSRKHVYERQKNITDKFVRTFLRIAYHFENFDIEKEALTVGYPLKVKIQEGSCNNPLLEELFSISSLYQIKEKAKIKKL